MTLTNSDGLSATPRPATCSGEQAAAANVPARTTPAQRRTGRPSGGTLGEREEAVRAVKSGDTS